MTAKPITETVYEDTTVVLLARVVGLANAAIVQADVTTITVKTTDNTDPSVAAITATPTVSDVVFDTLQTGGPWSVDSTGYNFKYALPYANIPTGDHVYSVDVTFAMADSTTRLCAEFTLTTLDREN